ncbi:ATP-binding cassette domain-containing protein [Rossellomorea vietnamensis]|uniref:ATP-binding cassette domain-containing protein n=1 Tax=Rossellomorea vietnamensis TaxID=218284 RepID=A0A6I6UQ89_9BACI|nr:ABC transporter ATP-binding protein [Rossellomorea vietnamensis]QHE60650.1 ATP-binding cassette domain-containing protein [Rossellomorea vietnamensis]
MVNGVKVDGVSKVYKGEGVETHALLNVTAEFQQGEFVSVVGSSGSGKSTLLSVIGTLDRPTGGSILFESKGVTEFSQKEMADFRFENIGFIFQQFHLIPTMTAMENVMAPLFSRKVPYDKKQRAKELLESIGLGDKLNSLPSQLSGGQQQRVAIARALVHEPKWLLADEPTGNLDTETGELIFQIIKSLNKEKGCGVIFVTHDSELAEKADRIIEMKDGRILSDRMVGAL